MTTVRDIYNALFAFAPASMKMDWDNVGLLCGRFDAPVDTVLVALDPMPDVIDEAKKTGAQCIVTHHPLFFDAPRAVNDASYEGRCILELAEAKIAAINLHTNLDVCPGGVNDVLAEALGLTEVSVLNPTGTDARGRPYGLIRTGMVREQRLAEFAAFVKSALSCPGLRFADAGKPVRRVAVGGGSCGGAIDDVLGQTRDKALEQALLTCRETHRALEKQTKTLLAAEHIPEKSANAMARGMSWLKTSTKLAVSPADETVADLITDGCNMGVKSLIRYRNRYPNASEAARSIAGQLIDSEQLLCKSMQPYL